MSGQHHFIHEGLAGQVADATPVKSHRCYQCGKCTAGCPLAAEMDYPPSQIMRMLQIGTPQMDEAVLRSHTIWLCLSCETCFTRCPQEIDIPVMMDFLRGESMGRGLANPKAKDIISFHKSFLDSIRFTGRLFEVGLVADYKLRSRHFMQDLLLAPRMFFKGKLGLLPHGVKNRKSLARIFKKTMKRV